MHFLIIDWKGLFTVT